MGITTSNTTDTGTVDAGKTPEELAAERENAVSNPAPVETFDQPSGAMIESEAAAAVDVTHEAIDNNPRAGTSALQNAIDLNDAKRASPSDANFAGQGIDTSVYGDIERVAEDRAADAAKADAGLQGDAGKKTKAVAKTSKA